MKSFLYNLRLILSIVVLVLILGRYLHADEYSALVDQAGKLKRDAFTLQASAKTAYNMNPLPSKLFFEAANELWQCLRDRDYDAVRVAYYNLDQAYWELSSYLKAGTTYRDKHVCVFFDRISARFKVLKRDLFAMKIITEEREYIETQGNPRTDWKYKVKGQYKYFKDKNREGP